MPALEQRTIDDLTLRLKRALKDLGNYGEPNFLAAGGSAAVYYVPSNEGPRAFKLFDPGLIDTQNWGADRRRLEVQKKLIGHSCPSLVQTYRVIEKEGTAIMEMEFIDWPQLTKSLHLVPDESIIPLITQLVDAVKFLESANTVHRDIKPENIHVSPDFTKLKLLDLGVAREINLEDDQDAAVTDTGNMRPFLATAQYSSPEYLFRLDQPSNRLWKGLNIYQVGAVLHDLIMKEPLFNEEINMGNRWLVARAVLTKTPIFSDANPSRLPNLKALSARCLVKDLETRLRLVDWSDFILENATSPLTSLQGRLSRGRISSGNQAKASEISRLEFDRTEFIKRYIDRVRSELISICGTALPLTVRPSTIDLPPGVTFSLSIDRLTSIECFVSIEWGQEFYQRMANIKIGSRITITDGEDLPSIESNILICTATISESEDESVINLTNAIATVANAGLDLVDITVDLREIHGYILK